MHFINYIFSAHCFAHVLNLIIDADNKSAPGAIPKFKSENAEFKKLCDIVRSFALKLRSDKSMAFEFVQISSGKVEKIPLVNYFNLNFVIY